MTNLAALKSMIEWYNADLFTKVMLERNVIGTATYTVTDQQNLDLCLADIYFFLAQQPTFKDGNSQLGWTPARLMSARKVILLKYGLPTDDTELTVDGTEIW
jgi:hypothetical protein